MRRCRHKKGYIVTENPQTGRTTKKGVFAGGDIVTGAATVIFAAGAGRMAGMAIDKYLADGEWWDPNAPPPPPPPAEPAKAPAAANWHRPSDASRKPSSRQNREESSSV